MFEHPDLAWPRINDYLIEIGTARNVDQLLHLALSKIDNVVPFDFSGILGFIDLPQKVVYYETCGGTDTCNQAFRDYYYRVMPDVGVTVLKYGATDWHDFSHTEYVTDFIRPHHIRYSAGIAKFGKIGERNISISINRSDEMSFFTEADLRTLELLQTHLSNYCTMLTCIETAYFHPDAADIRDICRILTRRESEIAALVCRKCPTELIGSKLLISPLTVYKHLENIYTKLKVNCRKELRAKLLGIDEETSK